LLCLASNLFITPLIDSNPPQQKLKNRVPNSEKAGIYGVLFFIASKSILF